MSARTPGLFGLVAAVLVLTGCSNHSGLTKHRPPAEPAGSTAAVAAPIAPVGLAGATASTSRSSTPRPTPTLGSGTAPSLPTSLAGPAAAGRADRSVGGRTSSSGGRPASSSAPAPAGPGGPAVAVRPSTGLADGQTVTVTGTGFPAGQPVTVHECRIDGPCDYLDEVRPTADGRGRVSAALKVVRAVLLMPCGDRCVITAAVGKTAVSAGIRFG
jgi:hypothetical protein